MFLAHFVRLLLTSFGGYSHFVRDLGHSLRSFLGLTSFANSHFVRDVLSLRSRFSLSFGSLRSENRNKVVIFNYVTHVCACAGA